MFSVRSVSSILTVPLFLVALATWEASGQQFGAQIWVDNQPDYFRRGDAANVSFSVPRDSYVAIVHIDTNGNLDFLYPSTPWDNHQVRGGRVYPLHLRGGRSPLTIRGGSGIGYLYLVASPHPLDFSYFSGAFGASWDWGYAGRRVYGDPFLAFDQVTRLLIPDWEATRVAYAYQSYHVGRVHRYPTFACSNISYGYGWGWSPGYGRCLYQDRFLSQYPYYYDTRRYTSDRRAFLRQFDRLDPRHGFKEPPRRASQTIPRRDPATEVPGNTIGTRTSGTGPPRREPADASRSLPGGPTGSGTTRAREVGTAPPSRPADEARTAPRPSSRPAASPPTSRPGSSAQPASSSTRDRSRATPSTRSGNRAAGTRSANPAPSSTRDRSRAAPSPGSGNRAAGASSAGPPASAAPASRRRP